jgi:hypothetical protein
MGRTVRIALAPIGAALLVSRAALATPDFPGVIQQQLNLSTQPPCTICHQTDAGGFGTATKPFALYLKSRGLAPFDEQSLITALAAAEAEHHDSNGNGVPDIDELKAGHDPNAGAGDTPQYGCGASFAGARGHRGALFAWGAMALWLLARRARRRP